MADESQARAFACRMMSPGADFPGEREWERIAQRHYVKRERERERAPGREDDDAENLESSGLFSAPCSPDVFPGQRGWERVALLRWLGDAGIDSNLGCLRSVGVRRLEDLASADKESVVRTLGLTPTKETAFRDRLPRSPVDRAGEEGRVSGPCWLAGSPCGADRYDAGCALTDFPRQPRFGSADESSSEELNELLLQTAVAGDTAKLAELLSEPTIDVNHCREDETTALMFAAMKGHRDCVELLLSRGASIDCAVREPRLCVHGWTAFHFAAEANRTNCAIALLHAGCDWRLQQSSPNDQQAGALPEMSASVRAAIASCELDKRLCRARQRLAFARGTIVVVEHAAAICPFRVLAHDLVEECCRPLQVIPCATPFARRVQATALR